ncbi:hypothetical protein Y1Q_0023819 [Alligator mississippiensis]|uniref:Uncharacterized protein n=1 Tax=Alligator mississippiensis TaxID=8496 RepID=A0A151MKA1_ALLMI|nr:hypothetical protein Y1Q_0023819 [Alligator mississippiensis]
MVDILHHDDERCPTFLGFFLKFSWNTPKQVYLGQPLTANGKAKGIRLFSSFTIKVVFTSTGNSEMHLQPLFGENSCRLHFPRQWITAVTCHIWPSESHAAGFSLFLNFLAANTPTRLQVPVSY